MADVSKLAAQKLSEELGLFVIRYSEILSEVYKEDGLFASQIAMQKDLVQFVEQHLDDWLSIVQED